MNVTNERPMLRISATIILAFICAAPFVLLFSGVVMQSVKDRVGMDTSSSLNWARERRVLI